MKDLQQELLNESKQRMITNEGKEDLQDEDIVDISNVIIASISGGPWAVMDEYGTGSLMDTDNPHLDDYKNSPMWNPARRDNKIRTRPDQSGQLDIFGNPINGRGRGGFDLEGAGIVDATPPSHAIETTVRWMQNGRFSERIRQEIQRYPFHKFIVVDDK